MRAELAKGNREIWNTHPVPDGRTVNAKEKVHGARRLEEEEETARRKQVTGHNLLLQTNSCATDGRRDFWSSG
jgi:hypothetical protein